MLEEFYLQQKNLSRKVESGAARFVFLDPVESWPDWVVIVVEHPTGVVYGQQCAGTATDLRLIEGYLVPLGGPRFDVESDALSPAPLTSVFHSGRNCTHGWGTSPLPDERYCELAEYIETIPYWYYKKLDDCVRERVRVDETRMAEICEAWVPVLTPEGKGVLLWGNCD
jgi:hypothetical protein